MGDVSSADTTVGYLLDPLISQVAVAVADEKMVRMQFVFDC